MRNLFEMTQHHRGRAKDLILYVLISLLILAVVFTAAMTGLREDIFMKWLSFVAFTLLLFGYFIADNRSLWKRPQFWIMSGVCFLIHLLGFIVLFAHLTIFKPIWFGLIGLVEMFVLLVLKKYLL
jgi:hypothetical protein